MYAYKIKKGAFLRFRGVSVPAEAQKRRAKLLFEAHENKTLSPVRPKTPTQQHAENWESKL